MFITIIVKDFDSSHHIHVLATIWGSELHLPQCRINFSNGLDHWYKQFVLMTRYLIAFCEPVTCQEKYFTPFKCAQTDKNLCESLKNYDHLFIYSTQYRTKLLLYFLVSQFIGLLYFWQCHRSKVYSQECKISSNMKWYDQVEKAHYHSVGRSNKIN